MKEVNKATIARWKEDPILVPKIDYTMNTRYYRSVSARGEKLAASVDPMIAIETMTGKTGAILIEVKL